MLSCLCQIWGDLERTSQKKKNPLTWNQNSQVHLQRWVTAWGAPLLWCRCPCGAQPVRSPPLPFKAVRSCGFYLKGLWSWLWGVDRGGGSAALVVREPVPVPWAALGGERSTLGGPASLWRSLSPCPWVQLGSRYCSVVGWRSSLGSQGKANSFKVSWIFWKVYSMCRLLSIWGLRVVITVVLNSWSANSNIPAGSASDAHSVSSKWFLFFSFLAFWSVLKCFHDSQTWQTQ